MITPYIILSVTSYIIGIPSIIFGCDQYYMDCLYYTPTYQKVIYAETIQKSELVCLQYSGNICQSVSVKKYWVNNIAFENCAMNDTTPFLSKEAAINFQNEKYSIYSCVSTFLVKETPTVCDEVPQLHKNLGIVGITFLLFGGLIWVGYGIRYYWGVESVVPKDDQKIDKL